MQVMEQQILEALFEDFKGQLSKGKQNRNFEDKMKEKLLLSELTEPNLVKHFTDAPHSRVGS